MCTITVFTDDDPQSVSPEFPALTEVKIENVVFSVEKVEEVLTELNPNSWPRWSGGQASEGVCTRDGTNLVSNLPQVDG